MGRQAELHNAVKEQRLRNELRALRGSNRRNPDEDFSFMVQLVFYLLAAGLIVFLLAKAFESEKPSCNRALLSIYERKLRDAVDGHSVSRTKKLTLADIYVDEPIPVCSSGGRYEVGSLLESLSCDHHGLMHFEYSECADNLRALYLAKLAWAVSNSVSGDTRSPDINVLVPSGRMPACPNGGQYRIGSIGEKPTCTISRHSLE